MHGTHHQRLDQYCNMPASSHKRCITATITVPQASASRGATSQRIQGCHKPVHPEVPQASASMHLPTHMPVHPCTSQPTCQCIPAPLNPHASASLHLPTYMPASTISWQRTPSCMYETYVPSLSGVDSSPLALKCLHQRALELCSCLHHSCACKARACHPEPRTRTNHLRSPRQHSAPIPQVLAHPADARTQPALTLTLHVHAIHISNATPAQLPLLEPSPRTMALSTLPFPPLPSPPLDQHCPSP